MGFDIEAARADGLSEEEIQAAIAYGKSLEDTEEITTEEVVVTPEPPQPQPTTGFDVERARADGLTDREIQEAIEYGKSLEVTPQPITQSTTGFDVERARADGLTDREIQDAIAYGKSLEVTPTQQPEPPQPQPTQPTGDKEYAGFFESAFGALGDYFDIASVGSSALLPGGETTDEAARRFLKDSETKPARARFSFADIEKAWSEGGMEGLKETIQQMPGGLGEAIGMIGPSIAAGATGFALGGPLGAILLIAASSAAPQMGGNVVEQASADLEAGRPLDVENAKALVALIPQVALDVIPFKFGALGKLVGLNKKLPPGELRKKIAEEGLGKATAKNFVSIVGQEVPTEIGQEIITKVQAGVDPFSPEAIVEYKELGALVFFTGGLAPFTAYKGRQQAKTAINQDKEVLNYYNNLPDKTTKEAIGLKEDLKERGLIIEEDTDSSEENTELKADDILKGWNAAEKKQQRKQANQDIKNRPRSTLNILDKDTLEVMGVNEKDTPILYNALLNKSTTTKQGREEIKEIFNANSGNYVNVDSTAVNSFLKRIAKPNDPKTKRFNNRRTGASPVVSQQQPDPNETNTPIVETDERAPVDDGSGDTGRTGDGASQFNDTLKNKNPLNKNLKPKQKRTIAEIIDNKVVIRKGVVIKQEDGTLALQEDGSGEIITFNENQVINPTKKDQGVLSTIAEETKPKKQKTEEKVEDFIKGPQFAKDETPSDKQELEKLRFAVDEGEYQASSYNRAGEPVPQRLKNRINNDRRKLRLKEQEIEQRPPEQQEQEQEIEQRPPEQQELFARGAIENTGETKESILQSFINQYGKNVSLGLKRGFINILSTGADVTSEMLGGQKLPANAKAFYNNGKAYFIADRIKASDAPSMLLHEIGAHYGLEAMLGKANYDRVVKSLNNKKNSDKDIKAAYDYVVEKYPELTEGSSNFIQEVLAKIGEQTPNNTLFRQVVGYIKNFLSKLGMGWNVDNISVAEIQDMIQQSLRVSLAKEASQDARPGILTGKDKESMGEPFYSPLRKVIDAQKIPVMDAGSWKTYIKKQAARQGFGDQLEATGIFDFIDLMSEKSTKIPKELLQNYIAQNDIKIQVEQSSGPLSESEIENLMREKEEEIYNEIRNSGQSSYINFDYNETLDALIEEKGYVINRGMGNSFLVSKIEDVKIINEIPDGNNYKNSEVFSTEEAAETFRDEQNDLLTVEVDAILDDAVADYIKVYRQDVIEDGNQGYSDMQRTGGENTGYTELVITVDNAALEARVEEEAERISQDPTNIIDSEGGRINNTLRFKGMTGNYTRKPDGSMSEGSKIRLLEDIKRTLYQDYRGVHYGDNFPNAILHIRYDIRIDQDGNKVMWVEELQSDWAEDLRKGRRGKDAYGKNRPFVQDTQLWMKLGVKTIIREAAELGVDKVAFLSPAQAQNVHSREKKAAEVSYGEILPGVIKRVVNQLDKSALPTKDSIKKQPKKDQIIKTPELEIIDLRPGIKPNINDKQKFDDIKKEIKETEKKQKILSNKPYYKYLEFKTLQPFLDEYAYVLMKEAPGIRVEFSGNGKVKVSVASPDTYTNLAMNISYADFKTYIEDQKKAGADAADAFTSEEFLKRYYQKTQKLKSLLEKTKRLAEAVTKDHSIIKNDLKIRNKIIKSFKDRDRLNNPAYRFYDKKYISFLKSNVKIEKLIHQPGANPDQRFAMLTASSDEVFKKYTIPTRDIYNAPPEIQKKINKYRPNADAYSDVFKELMRLKQAKSSMEKIFVGLKTQDQQIEDAAENTGEQLGFTMTPKLTESALAGQPMFAKQGTENARKLYKESNPEKSSPNQEQKSKDAFEKNMEESTVSFFSAPSKEKIKRNLSRFANAVFSFDNALNSAIRKAMEAAGVNPELQKKLLTKISLSQALHAESLGDQFVIFGLIKYNPETGKWNAVQGNKDTPTLKKIAQSLKKIAKQRGMKLKELKKIAGAAITGKRLRLLKDQQSAEIARAKAEFDKGNKQKAKDILKDLKIIHKTDAEIDAMVKIFDEIPQLNKIYDDWLAIRDEAVDALVVAQKLPQSEVDKYKAEVDFVPFYRVQEELNRIGPNPSTRGLIDNRWYKFKGSYEPVNDVFENMEMWAKYSIRRAVLNQAAINKVDATIAMLPDMVRQVADASGANTQPIERRNSSGNIETVYYQFADPTFAAAFGGMEQANMRGMSIAAKIANILRANVVLYPLFSIAQLPQDAVSAMFSSGVKYPFMIPLRVLKEFPLTFLNLSKTHKNLAKIGAVGSFGSYAQTAFDINNRNVKEMGPIRKSLELLTNTPVGEVNEIPISILGLLNRLAMASDNAIRQAVYEQTMSETNDVGLAEERAFEIINFKRGGSSGAITALRQVVPFFGAALQALSVQGRMLGGKGIAPTKNDGKLISASAKQFMSTWAQVTTATLLYNLLMDDDEEYEKLDPALRDRRILLGNGYHITLRPDIFTYMSKMVPEQIFQYTFRGSEDSQKFTKRLKMGLLDVLGNAPVPQIIRPAMELIFNESILTDRPIVPQSTDSELLSGDPEMQAKASTSELAKMLGEASGLNPLQVDYFLKQYFGYTIGLGLMLTDNIIADRKDNYERPGKSERDMIASIPGMSAFITREYGNRHTADYYELKELVSDAYKSFNALEKKSWDRNKSIEFNNKYASLIKAQEYIKTKDKILTQVRARRARVLNAPLNMMNAEDKRLELVKMNELEQKTLFDILEMRKKVFDDKTGTYRREGQKSNNPFN